MHHGHSSLLYLHPSSPISIQNSKALESTIAVWLLNPPIIIPAGGFFVWCSTLIQGRTAKLYCIALFQPHPSLITNNNPSLSLRVFSLSFITMQNWRVCSISDSKRLRAVGDIEAFDNAYAFKCRPQRRSRGSNLRGKTWQHPWFNSRWEYWQGTSAPWWIYKALRKASWRRGGVEQTQERMDVRSRARTAPPTRPLIFCITTALNQTQPTKTTLIGHLVWVKRVCKYRKQASIEFLHGNGEKSKTDSGSYQIYQLSLFLQRDIVG